MSSSSTELVVLGAAWQAGLELHRSAVLSAGTGVVGGLGLALLALVEGSEAAAAGDGLSMVAVLVEAFMVIVVGAMLTRELLAPMFLDGEDCAAVACAARLEEGTMAVGIRKVGMMPEGAAAAEVALEGVLVAVLLLARMVLVLLPGGGTIAATWLAPAYAALVARAAAAAALAAAAASCAAVLAVELEAGAGVERVLMEELSRSLRANDPCGAQQRLL